MVLIVVDTNNLGVQFECCVNIIAIVHQIKHENIFAKIV